ncbi:MAG: DnaJ domain-containing protein [Leptolyngbyaceae cyanobacterium SL_7_1]|nr:DnaJ domain-containing protein [Leptolyngbyaceae cyanobacterium SL_7_1]
MSQTPPSPEWLQQLSDPYAVLGLSVAADNSRVLKRYRTIAKLLHPDRFAIEEMTNQELASQMLARVVNPAYQRLKQENGRAETLAMLRFRVRRLSRDEPLAPFSETANRLIQTAQADVEVFYEQAIASLADAQYREFERLESTIQQLNELNLVYLRLKMGEPLIREKRTGIVSAKDAKPIQFTPVTPDASPSTTDYAQRHFMRAHAYMEKSNWASAVQELRDAIKIEPNKSEYHALVAKAYLMQNLQGMAKVHFKQALKLNPSDPLALEYAQKLKIEIEPPTPQNPKVGAYLDYSPKKVEG